MFISWNLLYSVKYKKFTVAKVEIATTRGNGVRQMIKKLVLWIQETDLPHGELLWTSTTLQMAKDLSRAERDYRPAMGITKASLKQIVFCQQLPFQETTQSPYRRSIRGKKKTISGLKENVIIGKIIPAGTGMARRTLNHKQSTKKSYLAAS